MQLNNPDLLKQQVFIDGLWLDAADGKNFAVTNPATGESIANVPSVSTAQVE
jgi:succinate-semialdehyde dehydrogenase/glutarate-semialdehyde dehydrogenase